MESYPDDHSIDRRLAQRLKALRIERQWSLDDLAEKSGVSRASLSRIENGEVSPTAQVMGRLCAAFALTMSRLMLMVEDGFPALVQPDQQPLWTDPETGFRRLSVSPPALGLKGEVIRCALRPGTTIAYDNPPRAGLEHHLVMIDGELLLTVDGRRHALKAGDCLRYQLAGASRFETPAAAGASYYLFIV